jgi:hypothetical protein
MKLRVVAIPLIAAICAGSPAIANPTDDEQQVRGRGARDRGASRDGGSAGGNTAASRGGEGGGTRATTRAAEPRGGGGERATAARDDGDRGSEPQRVAVPREPNQGSGYRGPVVVSRNRPGTNVHVASAYRGPRYYAPVYYDRWARHYYHWSPIGYAPWSLIYGSIGYANFGFYGGFGAPFPYYGYGYPYPPGPYSPWQVSGYDIGGVRLKIRPRDAQVFVDGNYAGLVDDFDGTFQSLRIEQGGHKIEIHMPGFEDLELDVHVQPGRTITLSETLRPRP